MTNKQNTSIALNSAIAVRSIGNKYEVVLHSAQSLNYLGKNP